MNLFRIAGDWSHVAAIALLLAKILFRKSCLGISGRTQLLFAIVYTSRYSDLWLDFKYYSLYNTAMKCFFMGAAFILVFLIFLAFRKTYQHEKDTFLTELLLLPCFILGLRYTYDMDSITEVLWSFSIYLEVVAIIPQLFMIYRSKQIEKIILYYLVALGLYRSMYVANWVYRYFTEDHFDCIASTAGVVYVLIYIAAIIVFSCAGVSITEEGDRATLRSNIFFISSTRPLDTSDFMEVPIIEEKNVERDFGKFEI